MSKYMGKILIGKKEVKERNELRSTDGKEEFKVRKIGEGD